MRSHWLALGAADSAYAQQNPGPDEVTLKSGAVVRGTILEVDPGQRVTIFVLGSDKPRVIQWAEVADVDRGKYAPPPPAKENPPGPNGPGYDEPKKPRPEPESEAPSPEPEAKPEEPPGRVKLHIASDKPEVELREDGGSGGRVCKQPCDQLVDGRGARRFYFAGEGVTPSSAFTVDRDGDATAKVHAGSRKLRIGGAVATAGGIALLATGAGFLGSGFVLDHSLAEKDIDGNGQQTLYVYDAGAYKIAGGVMLGAGAAIAAGGIAMLVLSRTKYELKFAQGAEPQLWRGEF